MVGRSSCAPGRCNGRLQGSGLLFPTAGRKCSPSDLRFSRLVWLGIPHLVVSLKQTKKPQNQTVWKYLGKITEFGSGEQLSIFVGI